jgi:hypothetical protein
MSRAPDLARCELWRRRMREFERSAATVAEFCDRAGVSAAAFYQWRRKLSDVSSSEGLTKPPPQATPSRAAAASLNFLPVEIRGPRNGDVVEVLLPNGSRVLVPSGDQESLRTVLKFLASEREEPAC